MTIRVLQLISSKGYYGAENVILSLSHQLQMLGHESVIGVFRNSLSPHLEIADQARAIGLPVQVFDCKGRFDRSAVSSIARYVSETNTMVVHTHGYKADLFGYFAARRAKVQVMATCHNWISDSFTVRLYEVIDRIVLRRFDAVVAVSDAVSDLLRKCGTASDRITQIPNGIDISRFVNAIPTLRAELGRDKRFIFGFVGRLSPEKGAADLINAISSLLCSDRSICLAIVGDGEQRAELEVLARNLGVASQVVFTGVRTDMPGVYASFDVFVLPSRNEAMPMALLEALAASRAVIASEVGAVASIVRPRQTGWLVPPGDSASLREALSECVHDQLRRSSMARAGHSLVQQRFSAAAMAGKYVDLYRTIISKESCKFTSAGTTSHS